VTLLVHMTLPVGTWSIDTTLVALGCCTAAAVKVVEFDEEVRVQEGQCGHPTHPAATSLQGH
jgi:hypothetical protein